ncbi:MAG: protein kinase [Lachnospiraceae bacterium]|nr:protein kinase [Lachnospiraceae bacterium]
MIRIGMFIEDRYEILEKIGSGGMSDVYKAKCHKLNRFVAIKFLKPEFCEDKNFVAKFQIEAQSAAALLHPNVVSVYDVNEFEGIFYIVMEFVDGITLKQYIDRNGRLPIKEATSIAIQIGQGIEAAHNANIIHRDIKPQNVLISREGKIKVTDFGIARTTTANTISQDILGSVHYISPEQARGGQVDERSDIYSFGVVYYEMVTGSLPFDGDSTVSIALKHIQESVPLVSDVISNVPTSVVRIIEKCTQKKPERRYQKMASLLSDLKTALISPNEDFVILEPEATENATVMMNAQDAKRLREEGRKATSRSVRKQPEEEYDEYDEYEDEYEDDYDEYEDEYDDEYDEYDDEYDDAYDDEYEDAYDDEYDEEYGYDDDDDDLDGLIEFEGEEPKKKPAGKDNSRRKLDKIILICGIVVGVIVLLVLGVVAGKAIKGGCAGSGNNKNTAQMIDVTNLTFEEARAKLEDAGFANITAEYVTSETVEKGLVIQQSEKEGDRISLENTIVLQVSSGKETVTLEDYKGKQQTEAQSALKQLGIQTKITTRYSDDVETGKIIDTNPAANTQVTKDTVVELIVSRGPEVKNATVPQLIGSTEEEAKSALTNLNLYYDIGYRDTSNASDVGRVMQQSHAAGSTVPEETIITLVVGKEAPIEPPTEPESPTEPKSEEKKDDSGDEKPDDSGDEKPDDSGDEEP